MTDHSPRELLARYVDLMNRRAWERLQEVLHPDYVEEYPQSGERIQGIANAVAARVEYPMSLALGDLGELVLAGADDRFTVAPQHKVVQIKGTGDQYTFVLRTRYPDGSDWFIIGLAEFKDGLISRTTVFMAPGFRAARLAGSFP